MNSSLSGCLLGNQCMIVSNSMIYSLTTLEHNFVHYNYYLCEFFVFKGSLTPSLHDFPELHGISFDNIQIFPILSRTKLYISTFYRVLHHLWFPTCDINYYLKKGVAFRKEENGLYKHISCQSTRVDNIRAFILQTSRNMFF